MNYFIQVYPNQLMQSVDNAYKHFTMILETTVPSGAKTNTQGGTSKFWSGKFEVNLR